MACDSSCVSLTVGLVPSCEALNKPGGLAPTVYVGQLSTLDSYTTNGTTLDVETLTMCMNGTVPYTLKKFKGQKLKHSKTEEVIPGENFNAINQILNLVLYHFSSLDKAAIESLLNVKDAFVIVQNNAQQMEIYGLDVTTELSSDNPLGGLKVTAGSGSTGVLLQDSTAFTITLSGEHRIISRIFRTGESSTLAQDLAYLDGISD